MNLRADSVSSITSFFAEVTSIVTKTRSGRCAHLTVGYFEVVFKYSIGKEVDMLRTERWMTQPELCPIMVKP